MTLALIAVCALPGLGITSLLCLRAQVEGDVVVEILGDSDPEMRTSAIQVLSDGATVPANRVFRGSYHPLRWSEARVYSAKPSLKARPVTLPFSDAKLLKLKNTRIIYSFETKHQPTLGFFRNPQSYGEAIRLKPAGS
jgi:hypothetical protein